VARFNISGPSMSRHLSVLKTAGLVTERRQANRALYSLSAGPVQDCLNALLADLGGTTHVTGHGKAGGRGKGKRPKVKVRTDGVVLKEGKAKGQGPKPAKAERAKPAQLAANEANGIRGGGASPVQALAGPVRPPPTLVGGLDI
jgi:DNA-binding transcriptional ArsR family regulator